MKRLPSCFKRDYSYSMVFNLIGTDYSLFIPRKDKDNLDFDKEYSWYLRDENSGIFLYLVTFEEVLNRVSDEIKEELIYHMDLFV